MPLLLAHNKIYLIVYDLINDKVELEKPSILNLKNIGIDLRGDRHGYAWDKSNRYDSPTDIFKKIEVLANKKIDLQQKRDLIHLVCDSLTIGQINSKLWGWKDNILDLQLDWNIRKIKDRNTQNDIYAKMGNNWSYHKIDTAILMLKAYSQGVFTWYEKIDPRYLEYFTECAVLNSCALLILNKRDYGA